MENTYGISVDNRYELFYIDDEATDPLEAIAVKKKATKEKPKEVRKGAAEKENKAATINKVPVRTVPAPTKAVAPTKATPEKPNRQTRDEKPAPKRDDIVEKKNRRNREQTERVVANGVGGGDEKPRRRKFEGRGKREFDRQSGSDKTGVKAVDKREGGGAHNWGSHKQEVIDELAPKPHPAELYEGEPRAETQDNHEENTVNQSPNQDEETKELTLDEYKAMRAGKSKPPQYNLRKAGEGEDLSQWKKMVALEAKRPSGDEDGDNDATSFQQRATRQKHILDIEFHFNDGRRTGQMGRGPRGGRPRAPNAPGGGRQMGRNRRNDGDERPQPRNTESNRSHYRDDGHLHAAPKVDDEKDFPSLGLMNTQVVRPVKAAAKIVPIYAKEDAK
ncbi:plasminogen activator inhibitor 1 RNA-binding protein-like isoform X4 [Lutzomyia longipalpis]|uniref:plasminogen activator inhibitor 1 RNA-binding protein-like isoform X4 n=1 Tax=Lutzomyia longipalpis TaxID=7200 RepID=UPI002483429A|nr:plasminogen activator inhibitor 1 RNA-binding protein-like isoform X4 [Lutzomyia longipalpis]XP_055690088.1 plasminogen activator inhibitor 1 RNA-binding protein-like isoform X4 [Lutzomyia longipalpis]